MSCAKKVIPVLFVALALPFSAVAQSSDDKAPEEGRVFSPYTYYGIGGASWQYSGESRGESVSGEGISLRAGYQIHPNFGWELRGGFGGEEQFDNGSIKLDQALTLVGMYSRSYGERARLGVYLGYTDTVFDISSAMSSTEVQDDGLTFGASAEFSLDDGWALYLDYGTYLYDPDSSFRKLTAGVVRRF